MLPKHLGPLHLYYCSFLSTCASQCIIDLVGLKMEQINIQLRNKLTLLLVYVIKRELNDLMATELAVYLHYCDICHVHRILSNKLTFIFL